MIRRTIILLSLPFLLTIQGQAQQPEYGKGSTLAEVATGSQLAAPTPLSIAMRDFSFTQAYTDAFAILSKQNECSGFYGGPRIATTVLNRLVALAKPRYLSPETSFEMSGKALLIRDPAIGAAYRLYDRMIVNTNGSFYQHRLDSLHRFPQNIGRFAAGSRPARALILLHELGHLIQSANGAWLIPNDGNNGQQSNENTLRIQQVCGEQLKTLN